MTEQNNINEFDNMNEFETLQEQETVETENFTDELETERKLPDTQMLEVKNTPECKNCEAVLERSASVLSGQFSRQEVATEETESEEPQETEIDDEVEVQEEQEEPETEVKEEEQPKLKPSEICKSKAAFNDFILNNPMPLEICEIMQNYPKKPVVKIAELTQNIETLINTIGTEDFDTNQYLVYVVTRAKDEIVNTVKRLNGKDGLGVFIIRAYLYNDETEIGFECLLKPELKEKVKRVINTETPAKQVQLEYWKTYFDICDLMQPDLQVTPLPRHYQPVSIGVKGVQIMQTINTQKNYIASEIGINNDKTLFEKLLEHKEEIESEVGELEWDSKETNKSAKIRKTYYIDINNPENHEKAAEEHVKMAEELRDIAIKYLK